MSLPVMLLLVGASALYAARGVAGVLELLGHRRSSAWGRPLLAGALALHLAFLAVRGIECRGLPACSRLDSVALFLWLTALAFVVSARPYRIESVAPVFWPCFAAGMGAMWALASQAQGEPASFARLWLALHLVPVYVGYAGFAVAAGAGATYLVQERLLRRLGKGDRPLPAAKSSLSPFLMWRRLPALETLERVDWLALSFGFPMLTVGLVAGVVWAEGRAAQLGRAWYADPKVVGGIVVWLFYAAVLHVRLLARLRGRRAALLTLAGFVLTVATFVTAHAYQLGNADRGSRTEIGNRKSEIAN